MTATEYPNWFKQIAQENFEKFLLPEAGKPRLYYLQLGCFTGDASVWMLDNVLTGDQSRLSDVDTWQGAPNEPIQEQMDFEDVYSVYKQKTHGKKVNHYRTTTFDFLTNPEFTGLTYDFIYVDAHHTAASAFLDCELSWPLLKQGGMMAVDDYLWEHPDGNVIHAPKLGIAMWMDCHIGEFETLIINSQFWCRKQ